MLVWTVLVSLTVGFGGTLIVLFACMFELVRCSGLANQSIVMKRVFKLLGIIELSEEEKMDVIREIEYRVKSHVENWFESDDEIVEIPLSKLGLNSDAVGFEEVFKCICALIEESSVHEYIEDVTICDEDFYLQIHLDMHAVRDYFDERLKEWHEQGELERAEYYRSRGVI
ncbi:MAG: hypothetical protein K2G70_07050 [Turicibacter sp.]|nr:hypothetical protein [Turicibacter sp.]